METLDLHGIRHHQVDRIVEEFVLLNNAPIKIITGNSAAMRSLVSEVLKRHNIKYDSWHYGSIMVYGS